MKLFYRLMLWLTDRELTIALNTGRNPENIKALRADVAKWQAEVDRVELPPLFD
jgi:hypothetical protein